MHNQLIEAAHRLASSTLGEWSPRQQAEWERLYHRIGNLLSEMAKGSAAVVADRIGHDDDGSTRALVTPQRRPRFYGAARAPAASIPAMPVPVVIRTLAYQQDGLRHGSPGEPPVGEKRRPAAGAAGRTGSAGRRPARSAGKTAGPRRETPPPFTPAPFGDPDRECPFRVDCGRR